MLRLPLHARALLPSFDAEKIARNAVLQEPSCTGYKVTLSPRLELTSIINGDSLNIAPQVQATLWQCFSQCKDELIPHNAPVLVVLSIDASSQQEPSVPPYLNAAESNAHVS